ncbi:tetratricopeptide (TPR) repeat protein [Actinokineospora baliensis]|uniref:ATP-binding protein n=1 Tax=Actinokineospora baliensis TaxID=547056 RepID=UPI0019561287|nr:tetratricopeptide repeat protein [Actinokineospora baliensis]MBM7775950.1 tetratricopeptide (TPR) repeat protein [Actinokineospora baliensis]
MADQPTQNRLAATSSNVVQAHTVVGGVHFSTTPVALPVPRQLPADTAHFNDREKYLASLGDWLDSPAPVVPTMIVGIGGVGKTSLATHWAHRVRDNFPDGDLYLDLRGYHADEAVPAEDALEQILRSLDIPGERIPVGTEPRAALYRSLVYGKRILIVLDNAATPQQVRPLLPGSPTCRVLITSRSRLTGLATREGAQRMALDVLPPQRAVEVLARIAGAERVAAEPGAAADLAHSCGYLPLALRIVGSRLAANESLSLSEFAEELRQERLDALTDDEDPTAAVRVVFSLSYRTLQPDVARLFRLLGVAPGADIGLDAVAALADLPVAAARRLLDALVNAHLVREDSPKRYRFHDLLRVYAAERAAEDQERAEALRRLLTWYAQVADAAARVFAPNFTRIDIGLPGPRRPLPTFAGRAEALHWCDLERANLVDAVGQAERAGELTLAWQLPVTMFGDFLVRRPLNDWVETHLVALRAAEAAEQPLALAWLHTSIALAYRGLRDYTTALEHFNLAREGWQELGERWAQAWALRDIGDVQHLLGDVTSAVATLSEALELHIAEGDSFGEATALRLLGAAQDSLGDYEAALASLQRSLEIRKEHGDQRNVAMVYTALSGVHNSMDDPTTALDYATQALPIAETLDDWHTEARAHDALGDALAKLDRVAEAREHWEAALVLLQKLADPDTDTVQRKLG